MINLELPEALEKKRENAHNLARDLFRPISRKYDEHEHQYPEELDIFRPQPAPTDKAPNANTEKIQKSKNQQHMPKQSYKNLSGVIDIEEFCWGDLGLFLSIPGGGLGNAMISSMGTQEQKARFGSKWTAMAITEAGAGSDSASIQTTAVLDSDEWVLNGEKIFVTCADRCEAVVVWASIDLNAGKAGIKSFLVEKGTPGFQLGHLEPKMGIRASDTGTFVFKDCRIPKDNLLGNLVPSSGTCPQNHEQFTVFYYFSGN